MEEAIGMILTLILVPILTPKLLKIFKGVKRYSLEEIKAYKDITYPQKYKIYYTNISLILVVSMITIMVAGIIGIFLGEAFLQRFLFAKGAVYFSGSDGYIAFFLINFIALLFFLFGVFTWILLTIIKGDFKKYVIVQNAEHGFPYKAEGTFVRALKVILLFYLITAPISYLAIHNYKAVYNTKIVANSFFDLQDKEYSFNQVKDVSYSENVSYSKVGEKSTYRSTVTRVIFNFTDNKSIDFYSAIGGVTDDEFKSLYKILREHKISASGFPEKYK